MNNGQSNLSSLHAYQVRIRYNKIASSPDPTLGIQNCHKGSYVFKDFTISEETARSPPLIWFSVIYRRGLFATRDSNKYLTETTNATAWRYHRTNSGAKRH